MADITFTRDERSKIESIALELHCTIEDFFADSRCALEAEQWEVFTSYVAACVRRALEIGTLLHAVVDSQPGSTAYPGRGRDAFVRSGLAAWRDCFSPIAEIWRLAAIFQRVPGGESRVTADVTVLEVMAANRMFSALDAEYAAFFGSAS